MTNYDLAHITKPSGETENHLPVNVNDAKLVTSVEKLEVLTDYKVSEFPYSFGRFFSYLTALSVKLDFICCNLLELISYEYV